MSNTISFQRERTILENITTDFYDFITHYVKQIDVYEDNPGIYTYYFYIKAAQNGLLQSVKQISSTKELESYYYQYDNDELKQEYIQLLEEHYNESEKSKTTT